MHFLDIQYRHLLGWYFSIILTIFLFSEYIYAMFSKQTEIIVPDACKLWVNKHFESQNPLSWLRSNAKWINEQSVRIEFMSPDTG